MALAAVMHLFEQNKFSLDDPAEKYLPEFKGDQREAITIKHLMTHVSGLPDQLPENGRFASRARHAETVRQCSDANTVELRAGQSLSVLEHGYSVGM